MAGRLKLKYAQEFANVLTVEVIHNIGHDDIGVEVIIDGKHRPEYVLSTVPDEIDPQNKFTITFKQVCSGRIQVLAPNLLRVCQPTAYDKALLAAAGSETTIFGSRMYYVEDIEETNTSSTEPKQKVRLATDTDMPAGRYRIGWSYEWVGKRTKSVFNMRVQLDDTRDIFTYNAEANKKDMREYRSGYSYETLTEGQHFIDLDFWASNKNKSVSIGIVRMEMWRVSDGS